MAINYTDQGAIAKDSVYLQRVHQAVMAAALAISFEDQGASSAEDWATRQALAHRVLAEAGHRAFNTAVLAAVSNAGSTATDESGITDGELDTAVAAIWNDVAGIAAT